MDDVAAIIYGNIRADAQKSASASRVVLTYRGVGTYDTMEVVIRRVAHGFYSFNHSSKEKLFTVTAKNVATVIDMIVARMREVIDCEYATSRTVKILHDTEEDKSLVLWQAYLFFDGIAHDDAQFKQLRSELEEAARVAWNGVVDVRGVRDMDETDGVQDV